MNKKYIFNIPLIAARDLEDAVNLQFGCDIDEIRNLLFDDNYVNDCYKRFYYKEQEEYHDQPWEDEESIRLRNLVRAFLCDILPEYDSIMIDVSW